jgi:hypothetical protein
MALTQEMVNAFNAMHERVCVAKIHATKRGEVVSPGRKMGVVTKGKGRGGAKRVKRTPSRVSCAPPKDTPSPFKWDKGDDDGDKYVQAFTGTGIKLGGAATGLSRLVA